MKIPKHDLRCTAAPPQVGMCGCKLWTACKIQFRKMWDVCACGEFLDLQSAITILQFSVRSLNKIGHNSLIFNELCKLFSPSYSSRNILTRFVHFATLLVISTVIEIFWQIYFLEMILFEIVALAVTSCHHQESKLWAVVGFIPNLNKKSWDIYIIIINLRRD